MTEEEWLDSSNSDLMLQYLTQVVRPRHIGLSAISRDRRLWLYEVANVRRAWWVILPDQSKTLVESVEKYLEHRLSWQELRVVTQSAFQIGKPFDFVHQVACECAWMLGSKQRKQHARSYSSVAAQGIALSGKSEASERSAQAATLRDIFGNPFRPVTFDPAWRTEAAVGIAQAAYDSREFGNLPILADALQDAGCEHPDILTHLRVPGPHVRGCWVVDLVLGKT